MRRLLIFDGGPETLSALRKFVAAARDPDADRVALSFALLRDAREDDRLQRIKRGRVAGKFSDIDENVFRERLRFRSVIPQCLQIPLRRVSAPQHHASKNATTPIASGPASLARARKSASTVLRCLPAAVRRLKTIAPSLMEMEERHGTR
jgi:hypothetical protein